MRHTLATLRPQVQASRMVSDYVQDLYAPAARAAARVRADDFGGARELAAYRGRLNAAWPRVRVTGVDVTGLPDTPVVGAPMIVRAGVDLAGLEPGDVCVEAVVGRVDDGDELDDTVSASMKQVGSGSDGGDRFEAVVPLPHAGLLGYTVRVLPTHGLLASPAELGKIVLAG